MINMIIIAILALMVRLAARGIYKRRKAGGGCGCGCAGCSKAGMCQLQDKNK